MRTTAPSAAEWGRRTPGQRSGSVTPAIVSDLSISAGSVYADGILSKPYDAVVNVAELGLLLAAVVLPLILGVVAALMKKPWWWAAIVAVLVAMVTAIAPTPEPGEARFVAGDVPFLLIVVAVVSGLVWLGWFVTRRLRRRSDAATPQDARPSRTT
jgi:lysylphosphatidylglycerol synthetase-like protein (DUF2156 family)